MIDISLYNNHIAINYRLHDVCMLLVVLLGHRPKHQITGDHQKISTIDSTKIQTTKTQMLVVYATRDCNDNGITMHQLNQENNMQGVAKDQPDATSRVHKTHGTDTVDITIGYRVRRSNQIKKETSRNKSVPGQVRAR